jgi:phosphatidylserine decarboxylase
MHFHTPLSLLSKDKKVETHHETSPPEEEKLPAVSTDMMAKGLEGLVDESAKDADVTKGTHMHSKNIFEIGWITKLIPGIEKLANEYHIGNYVVVRGTNERIFESMPIYAR